MDPARLLRLLLALLLLAPAALRAAPAQAADRVWTMAVVPIMPPVEIKRRWQPVLDQASREAGLVLRFRFHEDFAEFERSIARGEVDFVVTSPGQAWKLRQTYRPLLRGRLPLTGLVVVRHDSPLRGLADLQGRTLCMQDGHDISSNLLVLQQLREQKIAVDVSKLNTESSALRSVVRGKSDAAVINNYLLGLLPPEVAAQVRVIHRTVDLPPPAISVNVRTPPEIAQKFSRGMLRLRETHPALLEAILMPGLTEADLERDYGSMSRLLPAEAPDAGR
ncbi:MAG: phosphate/phosphite/phosphonate transporter substrate-binding protein [Moraxellaceae bacterium]|jgi:phosphonate transport system substrate-binding protein|nr:phosphate/phosphite/phosphonate transporter substrate-binding protein [Moraxellaceae bacterium]